MKTFDQLKKSLEYMSITDVEEKMKRAQQGLPYAYVEEVAADALVCIQRLQEALDAAASELALVAEKVEKAASVIDNEIHPVVDYNIYLEMRNAVDAIAVWQYEPVWSSAQQEDAK